MPPARLKVANAPNGAMLLGHLSQDDPTEVGRYLDQMRGSEDIAEVAMQGCNVIEEDEPQ
jgi:hypothetical protein